jgi:DNA polymerase I
MWTAHRVSGSCADLLKVSMVKADAALPRDVYLVATVHDELVFDAPSSEAEQYCETVKRCMTEAFVEMFGDTLPVVVEARVCEHWGDKHPQ